MHSTCSVDRRFRIYLAVFRVKKKEIFCVVFIAWGYNGRYRGGCMEEPLIFTHCRPDCTASSGWPGPIPICFFGDNFWKEETSHPGLAHILNGVGLLVQQ